MNFDIWWEERLNADTKLVAQEAFNAGKYVQRQDLIAMCRGLNFSSEHHLTPKQVANIIADKIKSIDA